MANTKSLDLERTSTQYAGIADGSQSGLDITGNLTIEAWINIESLPASGTTPTIASKWDDQVEAARAYSFLINNSTGTYYFYAGFSSNGTNEEFEIVTWTPSIATWYHVAMTHDTGGNVKFYLNGTQQGATQTSAITTIANTTASFRIGALDRTSTYEAWDGLVDEVRVWNVVRTEAQILANMQIDVTGESGLVSYWKLEDDYTDSAGNNDLTAVGSPVFSADVPFANYTNTTTGNFFALL